MLFSKPTKQGAGIFLYGDYYDLKSLHETIHELSSGVPLERAFDDFVLELAYDIRKAYEGFRATLSIGYDEVDKVTYRGENVLWPTFLMQAGMLRWAAGFHTSTKADQANLFRLEACAESALLSYDPETGKVAFEWLTRFSGLPQDYLVLFLREAEIRYVTSSEKGKTRFKQLPRVLSMIDPISPEYSEFEKEIQARAKELNRSPGDLTFTGDLPDFKW